MTEPLDTQQIHGGTVQTEEQLGRRVRAARIAANLDQRRLADRANVSLDALSRLERGRGSTVRTLVAVVRALDRTDWIDALAPSVTVSPMQVLRAKQAEPKERRRVRLSRDAEE